MHIPVATREYSDYILSPDLTETAVQDAIPTESYGNFGLDGARYLRDVQHAEPMLCRLVAHHSCAVIEAEERGLAHVLTREFAPPPQPLADALTFCDMTTSPDGDQVQVTYRLAEIHDRYGTGHLVSRFIRRATPLILEAVGHVHARTASTS